MLSPHILIVDDETSILNLFREIVLLNYKGARVEAAESACEAMERLCLNDYDAILSDIQLQSMSGIDLVRETRELRPTPTIVLMTGDETLLSKGIESGAYACLRKPIPLNLVTGVLRRAVEFHSLQQRVERIRQVLALQTRTTNEYSEQVQVRIIELEKRMAEMRRKELEEITALREQTAFSLTA